MFRVVSECRICKGKNLRRFLDLGEMPLANSFLREEDLVKPEQKFPLRVLFCRDCNLSQLGDVIDPGVLFRNYIYFSSKMPDLPDHFKSYAEEVINDYISSSRDLVVEIGSNDGLLLGAIKKMGARILGIDPAENIAKIANERGIETIADFFSSDLAGQIVAKYGLAKVIIGNNVVAHIDDHQDLVAGVKKLLVEDGVFIFEAPYLVDMFENLTFDTIYHEHLSYLSLRPLVKLFRNYDIDIINVKIFPVQGNSFRVYAGKKGKRRIRSSVRELIRKEKQMKLDSLRSYMKLARSIGELKENLVSLLSTLRSDGKKIAAYGAPAKGNTLLNYFGIGRDFLEYATEELASKVGLFTPGGHIPVVHIGEARQNPPDYFLLLAWNYKEAILSKEEEFRRRGGKFIIPVGKVEII